MEFSQFSGLPSHPQHDIVKRQCTGCSGMLSFDLHGDLKTSQTFLSSLKVCLNLVYINQSKESIIDIAWCSGGGLMVQH